jgi:hypothetical protein
VAWDLALGKMTSSSSNPKTLRAVFYEDGKLMPIEECFSGQEIEALKSELYSLSSLNESHWDPVAKRLIYRDYWFDFNTYDDERGILVNCYVQHPHPASGSEADNRIEIHIPQWFLEEYYGKKTVIEPPQYGLSPWTKKVEVEFEIVNQH